jgi:hypothetical protein
MVVKLNEFHSAMPTVYRGVNLKSRLEAQCAFLLDALGMAWDYEPKSYMLPNGVAYLPDFWVERQRMYVECRGYQNERGASQIEQFGLDVVQGQVGPEGRSILRYVALQDEDVRCYRPRHEGYAEGCLATRCAGCDAWAMMGFGDFRCPTCLENGTSITTAFVVGVKAGKILLNGVNSEHWDGLLLGSVSDPAERV